ncbi:MAG: LysE family transporter [Anaerolineales bacterium]|nr:LysE family transporter [Anaerolineales bacterium]
MGAFGEGLLAGYAIAVPVGAIAVLILEIAMRRGLAEGAAAGAGAASVDLLYAALAGLAGQALAPVLAPLAGPLRWASALVLIGLGLWGLGRLWASRAQRASELAAPALLPGGLGRTYVQFVGLTLLNPMTVAYFTALMLGQNARAPLLGGDRLIFVLGVAVASFSWQFLLAGLGAWAHRRLSPQVQVWTSALGHVMVIILGARMLWPA